MMTKIKFAFTSIKARMPWSLYKLRKKGSKFVLNYSGEGDAKLTIWPVCEGCRADVVPVADRHYDMLLPLESSLHIISGARIYLMWDHPAVSYQQS
ncbi:MAG: hypothetical protein DDT40_01722 [candidate division WS2 bacterium]|nr:hypothetical protein [Candidatus Psychracetigena formicireducens]